MNGSGRPPGPPPSDRQPPPEPDPTRHQPTVDTEPAATAGVSPVTAPGRQNRGLLIGAVAVVVALVAGILIVSSLGGDDEPLASGAGEVFLQAAVSSGLDPFFEVTEELVDLSPIYIARSAPSEVAVDQPVAAQAISGTELGLYGGTKDNGRCNSEQIIQFLEANPDKAAAWSVAQGIDPSEIRPFVESLTAAVLLDDTRVTNHGFKNGQANPFQAVLQAGTAVLLDGTGVPRVRCACGNPLNKPVPQSRVVTYSGANWEGFDANELAVVSAAEQPTAQFVLQDLEGGDPFVRERGTSGEADAPAPPEVIAAIDPALLKPGLGDTSLTPIGAAASESTPETATGAPGTGTPYCTETLVFARWHGDIPISESELVELFFEYSGLSPDAESGENWATLMLLDDRYANDVASLSATELAAYEAAWTGVEATSRTYCGFDLFTGEPADQNAPESLTPLQVLTSRDYCTALQGYVDQASTMVLEDTDAAYNTFIEFVDLAIADLAVIAPPEIAADVQLLSDLFPEVLDSETDPRTAAAEERFDRYSQDVCGITS